VAGCCLFWAMLGFSFLTNSYKNDFLTFYIGGTIARQGRFADLYRPAAQMQVQELVAPSVKEPRPACSCKGLLRMGDVGAGGV
jgi:hypothetical protein